MKDGQLTDEEIRIVEERLGDYIDCYGAIALTLGEVIRKKKRRK